VAPADLLHPAPQFRQPIIAFLLLTTAYSILFSWLFLHTQGSVLLAALFHGAINIFQGFFLAGVDPASRYWWLALSYGTAAVALPAVLGPWLSQRRPAGHVAPRQHEEV
jgi:hypothetical protein